MDPGWINHQDTGFWSLSPPQFLRLLATPRLTGRGNAWPSGASVRFLSLSRPVLTIDAATKHSSGPDTHPQCQPASTALPLTLLSPPAPSLGGPRQGFQPGLQVNQILVAPRKIPWKCSGPHVPGQQDSPLLRAVGVGWTREETCSELFVPRSPGSRAKYSQSQAKHPRVCLE